MKNVRLALAEYRAAVGRYANPAFVRTVIRQYANATFLVALFSPLVIAPLYFSPELYEGGTHDFATGVVVFGGGALCMWLSLRLPNDSTRPGILSAIVLAVLVTVGIWGSSAGLSTMLTFGAVFVSTARERWEAVALISTAFMAGIYYDALGDISEALIKNNRKDSFKVVGVLLAVSIIIIIYALFHLHEIKKHYVGIFMVTVLFAVIDWWVFWELSDCTLDDVKDLAVTSGTYLLLLDLPVLLALSVFGIYLFTLNCNPKVLTYLVENGFNNEKVLSDPCVEVYPFLAGTLAFQMISFNILYVVFSFRLVRRIERRLARNTPVTPTPPHNPPSALPAD
jgi:hypothetical protein